MVIRNIIISRTDSIGDVILTLPLAGLIKEKNPSSRIYFLGMSYTEDIIRSSEHIDEFINWSDISALPEEEAVSKLKQLNADMIIHVFPRSSIARIAKKAGIPQRLGSTGRFYHYLYCNRLIPLSRKNSNLHEAQLNIKLIAGLVGEVPIKAIPAYYGLKLKPLNVENQNQLIDQERLNIIIHPKSKGSAREWGLKNYALLARQLSAGTFHFKEGSIEAKVFISGTAEEGAYLRQSGFFEDAGENVVDITGRFTLREFIQFINSADVLIAGSTGPLHIAAALGKIALGLYPPIKPMHPGRWAPIGSKAGFVVADKECNKCRNQSVCECMQLITAEAVQQKLEAMVLKYYQQTRQE